MSVARGTAQYAKLQEPSEEGGGFKSKYSIDLFVDAPTRAKLIKEGLAPKKEKKDREETGREFFRFWTSGKNKKGKVNPPVRIVDKFKAKVETEVGNGSDVSVQYTAFEYDTMGNQGIIGILQAVLVHDMRGSTADEFEYEEAPELDGEFDDDVPF